jgi:endonuclease/exonuclease/phosphatase family metal-dependent hydrolase
MKRTFLIFKLLFCFLPFAAAQITVATYNLRYDNVDDSIQNNGWKQRCPVICNLIAFHDFDILGTQEGKINQLKDMQNALPDYRYIGIGRDDGKEEGEFSAIFYKTNKIKMLDTGNFWLSENTEIPNIGWDADLPRICTWGQFEEIETGFQFYFFNLHADHRGVEARKNTAKLLLEKITHIADEKPTILTGDFNETQYSEPYRILNESGLVKDACETAKIRYTHSGTFTGFIFKPEDNPAVDPTSLTDDGRIDHIFLTPQFTVERCGILSDTYRRLKNNAASSHEYETRLPSDHYPVMAKLSHATFCVSTVQP